MLVNIPGIEEVSMTTNGTLLTKYGAALKAAGLKRVNISLDSLKPDKFAYITGGDKLNDVLQSIEYANNIGLVPVKINTVILKGINDDEIPDFMQKTITDGWNVRFIEHMPFAGAKKQDNDLVSPGKSWISSANNSGNCSRIIRISATARPNIISCPAPTER